MIGRTFPFGKGFLGIARYLEHGEAGEHRDRVLWVESRNLPTEDPQTAARLMAAHARESVRTQRPVYHFVIAFHPGDPVDRDSMRQVVDAVLRRLGLEEHQALIVAHKDTEHPHVHIVVNRVHPETHIAWENSWDWPKIEKELRAQEVALGMRRVPGRHGRVPGREPAPALERGTAAFLRFVQERAGPVLERARSWAEVERGLAAVGLSVRIKGRGLTIHDGHQEVKASDVDRAFSRTNMEERLGKWSADRIAADREREVGRGRTAGAGPEAEPVRERPSAPEPAPEPPVPPALTPGEQFARLLERERERVQDAGTDLRVREAAEQIRAARAADARRLAFEAAETARSKAAADLEPIEAAYNAAQGNRYSAEFALELIYTQAEDALRQMEGFARAHGEKQLERTFRETPEAFGELRVVRPWWGLGKVELTGETRRKVPDAVQPVLKAIRTAPSRPADDVLRAARKRVREATAATDAARDHLRDLPVSATCERKAMQAVQPLLRSGVPAAQIAQQLARLLPPEDREAARIAEQVVRRALDSISRGRTRERDRGVDFF
jgi:hypothetical protein